MSDETQISWCDATWNPWPGCLPSTPGCANCWARFPAWRMSYNPNPKVAAPYLGIVKKVLADGTEIFGGEDHPRRKEPGLLKFTGLTRFVPERLEQPLRWRRRRRIFVCSNSDLFLPARVKSEQGRRQIAAIFGVMAACPQHVFQVLTKWPGNMREWFTWANSHLCTGAIEHCIRTAESMVSKARERSRVSVAISRADSWPLPNVWIGTTVEDQQRADERIPELLRVPAAVRWLSVEPMLGPVDLGEWIAPVDRCSRCEAERDGIGEDVCDECGDTGMMITAWGQAELQRLRSGERYADGGPTVDEVRLGISWVVCGGESGPGARPMHPAWARSLRDQCVEAGVPFHHKQNGAWGVHAEADDVIDLPWFGEDEADRVHQTDTPTPVQMRRVGKKVAGRELDGRTWDEFPS